MRSLSYFFKEAIKGFTRNFSTTLGSIVTIFLSLLIIGVFLIGGFVVENVVASVEDKVSITAYLSDDAATNDVEKLKTELQKIDYVKSVSYTSKAEALENFKNSSSSNPEIVNQLDGENPLPASVEVELTDSQKVEQVASEIENNSTFRSVCDNPSDPGESLKYGQKTVEKLFALTNYIRYVGIALVVLLIFIALVFINNTIRLAILARRKEIAIMRLVGASNGFIRGPFLMEGALHALAGSLLAVAVLQVLRVAALPRLQSALTWLPISLSDQTFLFIYLVLVASGLIIGLIGSAVAMRRYLKV